MNEMKNDFRNMICRYWLLLPYVLSH